MPTTSTLPKGMLLWISPESLAGEELWEWQVLPIGREPMDLFSGTQEVFIRRKAPEFANDPLMP